MPIYTAVIVLFFAYMLIKVSVNSIRLFRIESGKNLIHQQFSSELEMRFLAADQEKRRRSVRRQRGQENLPKPEDGRGVPKVFAAREIRSARQIAGQSEEKEADRLYSERG